jgi:hypothetical protein
VKVRSITYRRGTTVNMGDYESVRIEIEATADLEEGEPMEDAVDSLRQKVCEEVAYEKAHVVKIRDKKYKQE